MSSWLMIVSSCLAWVVLSYVNDARADDPAEAVFPQAYDGFQASQDAQVYWDARRRDALNRQLGWNEYFKWRTATGQAGTFFYEPYVPTPLAYAPSPFFGDPYSSWPYAIGRITGYGFYNPVPQPIGRREVQTGPNRWESFPIYAEEASAPRGEQVLSAPTSPLRRDIAPPKVVAPAPPRGREF